MYGSWRKFSACVFFSIFIFSSAAAKKKKLEIQPPAFDVDAGSSVFGTKIALPEKREVSYFVDISADIRDAVERGSPETLRNAITYLKRNRDMTESERVLHYIAVSIMQMCWKSQNFIEGVTGDTVKNVYTGAISASKNGIYDASSSKNDFFSYALPSLVLAVSETRTDYYAESEKSLKEAIALNPNSVFAHYLLGLLYKRLSNPEQANAYFGMAYTLAPDCYECAFAYAESYYALSQPERAFELAEFLLRSYPQNKNVLKLCAEAAFAAGDSTNAELYVSRVLQIEPENAYYLLFRARILVKKGEYIRAASLLDAYARKDSSSRDYLVLRFAVQKNWNKNISAATATIENALVLYPDDVEIILDAATLASETGVKIAGRSGEELADQILASDPMNFSALQIKIAAMISKQKWAEAYAASSDLMKMENVPNSVIFTHIKICLSAGKKEEAWRLASKLYTDNPSDEDILQSYLNVLVSTSRTAEASRLITQLLPNANARMKSFLYYEKSFLSTTETAILADLRSSLTANPRNKDALFRLYRIYFNKKEYRKAQYYLKQVVALSPNDESLLVLNQNLEKLLAN